MTISTAAVAVTYVSLCLCVLRSMGLIAFSNEFWGLCECFGIDRENIWKNIKLKKRSWHHNVYVDFHLDFYSTELLDVPSLFTNFYVLLFIIYVVTISLSVTLGIKLVTYVLWLLFVSPHSYIAHSYNYQHNISIRNIMIHDRNLRAEKFQKKSWNNENDEHEKVYFHDNSPLIWRGNVRRGNFYC